ncbi:MAG TPA: hypothetical protein VK856_06705 [Anaerolineaceae bacterium]|nr:hypothetical protein [Anaerolineaceae bacterium]
MYKITTLTTRDVKNPTPANTFFWQEDKTDHLALILPGLNYTCDMPLLYYAAQLMLATGADVLQVKYDYTKNPQGKPFSLDDMEAQLRKDVTDIAKMALEQRKYQYLTIIAKSLGTLAVPHLLQADLPLHPNTCVYLTPILNELVPKKELIQTCLKNLFVIGTNDHYYDPGLIRELINSQGDNFMIIDGVNHSLEFPGDPLASLRVVDEVARRLETILKI